MANSAQAAKRARQANDRRSSNMAQRSKYRTYIKKVRAAITAGDKDAASAAMGECEPLLDRYAKRGILHKNTAARYKSRLRAAISAL